MFRKRNRPVPAKPSCKKHPGIAAVKDGLCRSCLHFRDQAIARDEASDPRKAKHHPAR
jgi:hypothetical protein